MDHQKRTAGFRLLTGISVLIIAGVLLPPLGELSAERWVILASLLLLTGIVYDLGIETHFGPVTFLPVIALTSFMAFDLPYSLLITSLGLIIGTIIKTVYYWKETSPHVWWKLIGQVLYPVGRNGFSLLAADAIFHLFDIASPLETLDSYSMLAVIVLSQIAYLLVFDVLSAADMWLRQVRLGEASRNDRITVAAIQLLPIVLAPFAAIAYARLGVFAFIIFEIIVLTVVIVVKQLITSQDALTGQLDQIRAISTLNQALRTSLEYESLLQTIYLQVATQLNIKNLVVILSTDTSTLQEWGPAFYIDDGIRDANPADRSIDGFLDWVLKNKEPLTALSVETTAQQLKISEPPSARMWIGVPLLTSTRQLGCMATWLGYEEQGGRSFSQADVEIFKTIAVQAEVAIENALLYEEAQQHAAQLSRLNKISTVMNAALNPEKLLELITESVIDVAGCGKAAIYLLEQQGEDPSLILAHSRGFTQEHIVRSKDIAVPLTASERKIVTEDSKAVTVPNVSADGAEISAAMLVLAQQEKFQAYAYLPLNAQNRMLGMLAVYYEKPHYFTASEKELLETFANQAALAVANARIYQETDVQLTRRISQIVQMSDISQQLSSTLDLDQVFSMIMDSAIEGCRADAGLLVLASNPELNQVDTSHPHMVAWRGFDPGNTTRAPHLVAEELANSEVLKKGETRLTSLDDPRKSGPRSQLSVPIFLEGEVIGAIVLESDVLSAFNQEDLSFVSQLAVQAAVAIRNAQLYRHVQSVRDRLHAILDASNDGLLMFDAMLRIVMTNTRMQDFWDFARQDFVPKSPDQFIADPTSVLSEGLGYKEGELAELVKQGIKNPGMSPKTDLYSTSGRGGHVRRFVERTATAVRDERGNFIGLLLIFRDVTDQKELEETRQNLTSMIVHELRSPLQAVMGSMRLIAEVTPDDDPVIDQATDVSKRAVKKLLNLVNNLLDLSRMEQGEFVLDPAITQVHPILQDAVEELIPLAREMDAVIKLDVPEDLPYSRVDRDMVGRVVLNLVDNALKYTEPGTLVRLTASILSAEDTVRHTDDMLCVQVVDQGPGIPDEFKAQIFDRFAQIPGRKGRRRSAGLGLAFCQMAVDSHGGSIWVEDNPEGGSIFQFTLPIVDTPPDFADDDVMLPPRKSSAPAPEAGKAAAAEAKPAPEPASAADPPASGDDTEPAGGEPHKTTL